ncbi:MAG: pseudaminic acid cytidylyltransferase [Pseudomonadota bacterium]
MSTAVAIIPARGGSKRIPHKNIRPFCGKPMLAWSVETALASGCFDRVIVSTDDSQIATVAKAYGAEVPFIRPAELANDWAGTAPVIRHAVEWLREADDEPDYVCCLYATAPLLQPESLVKGLERLRQDADKQFAFSVTSFAFPVQRALCLMPEGQGVKPMFPDMIGHRSQDLEEAFHDAGQFYWGRTEAWLDQLSVFDYHSIPVVLPRYRVQDIDTEEDWETAELVFRALEASS